MLLENTFCGMWQISSVKTWDILEKKARLSIDSFGNDR